MQLLPLLEMYCKWELQEDCTNLWALMVRFDSEVELESHELGRSLLFMVRDDADGIDILPARVPIVPKANPFDVVRERLSAVGHAIRVMHKHVQLHPSLCTTYVDFHTQGGSFEYVIHFLLFFQNAICSRTAWRSNNLANMHASHKASITSELVNIDSTYQSQRNDRICLWHLLLYIICT